MLQTANMVTYNTILFTVNYMYQYRYIGLLKYVKLNFLMTIRS